MSSRKLIGDGIFDQGKSEAINYEAKAFILVELITLASFLISFVVLRTVENVDVCLATFAEVKVVIA